MTLKTKPTQVFVKDLSTRQCFTLELSSASERVLDLQTRLRKMAGLPSSAPVSLLVEGKALPEDASCAQLRPFTSIVMQSGALPGGMINESADGGLDDDNFKAATDAAIDEVIDFDNATANAPSRRSTVRQLNNESLVEEVPEITNQELVDCHELQLEQRINRELEGVDQEKIDAALDILKKPADSFVNLSEERQKMTAKILAYKFEKDEELKSQFDNKDHLWIDYVNQNSQEKFLFRLRSREFCQQQLILVYQTDRQKAMSAIQVLQAENQMQIEFGNDHTTHPQGRIEEDIQYDWTGHLYHLLEDERDNQAYFRSQIGEMPEYDISLISNKFDLKTVVDLVLAMTPEVYRDKILSSEALESHKFIIELVETAKDEKFFELLPKAAAEVGDEQSGKIKVLLDGLIKYLKSQSEEEQVEMLKLTSHNTLFSAWISELKPIQVKKLCDSYRSSPKNLIEFFNKLDQNMRDELKKLYNNDDREMFHAYQVLYLTGQPRKDIKTLYNDAKSDYQVLNSQTFKKLQQLPLPGQDNEFICIGQQLGAAYFQSSEESSRKVVQNTVIDVKPFKLFEKEKLKERLQADDIALDNDTKASLINKLCPPIHYQEQMRKQISKEETKVGYQAQIWKLKGNDAMVLKNFYDIDEPLEWRCIANYQKDNLKKQFLFRGRDNEVFWFSKKKVDDEERVELNLLVDGQDEPTKTLINKESSLHRVMLYGAEDRQKKNEEQKHVGFILAVPQMFRDTPETPIITYSEFTWEKGRAETRFYDLNSGRDIGNAVSANFFIGLIPGEQKMLVHRDLLQAGMDPASEPEEIGSMVQDILTTLFLYIKAYPQLFVVDVDFAAMRESDGVTELIQHDQEACKRLRAQYEQMTLQEAIDTNGSMNGWITVKNDDPISGTQFMQTGAAIINPVKREGKMLAWHAQSFDPDADTNFDHFFELESTTDCTKILLNEPHHCYTVEDKKNDRTLIMQFNPNSGNVTWVDWNKPKTPLFTSDWQKTFDKGWFQPITISGDNIYRATISNLGQLVISVAQMPESSNDPQLKLCQHIKDDTDNPILLDYPLLSMWRSSNSISIDNIANPSGGKKIFNFEGIDFICYLEDNQAASDGRVNFMAKDRETGRLCIMHMRNERPFEKRQIKDLNNWYAEKFILHESFREIVKDRAHMTQSFLFDESNESFIRTEMMQPAIMVVTDQRIMLAMKGTYETIFRTTSATKLLPLKVIRSQNDTFYFVEQEIMSRNSHVVEIKLTCVNQKYSAIKRRVFTVMGAGVKCVQLDPRSLKQADIAWTVDNGKSERNPEEVNLYVLDENLGLYKIRQNFAGNYKKLWTKNLNEVENLEETVDNLHPSRANNMVISDRTLTIKDRCYVFESKKSFDIFYEEMNDWDIVEVQRARGTDKIIAKMRNLESGQFRYVVKQDLATRSVDLLGLKLRRDVESICWLSRTRLLVHLAQERRKTKAEENDPAQRQFYWTVIDTKGVVQEIPAALEKILNEKDEAGNEWAKAAEGMTMTGQRELILYSQTKVGLIKFAEDGAVTSYRSFAFDYTDSQNENPENNPRVARDEIAHRVMSDFEGNLYRISILRKGETTDVPKFKGRMDVQKTQLMFFEFEEGCEGTQYTVCGDYLCWRPTDSLSIHYCYMDDIEKNVNINDLTQFTKQIDLSKHHREQPAYTISINTLSGLHAIHAFPSREITMEMIRDSRNSLQVVFGNRSVVFKLDEETPISSPELCALDKFLEPHLYTENGIRVTSNYKMKGLSSEEEFGLSKWVQARPSGGYFMIKQKAIIPGKVLESEKSSEDERISPFLGLFRTYSEQALQEIHRLQHIQTHNLVPRTIDPQCLIANFDGSTIYSIFSGWNRLLELIPKKIEEMQLQNELDIDETEVENTQLRSINRILNQKVGILYEEESEGKRHIVRTMTIINNKVEMPSERDLYLEIGRLSKEFSIFDDVWDQGTFQQLIERETPQLIEEFDKCFRESKSSSLMTQIEWPEDLEKVTYRSHNFVFNENDLKLRLEEEIDSDTNTAPRPIKVRMFKIGWMMRDGKNFIVFSELINDCSEEFYQSEFMGNLLEQFWSKNRKVIFRRQFLPFCGYMLSTIFFMYYALNTNQENKNTSGEIEDPTVGPWLILGAILNLVAWTWQFRNEFYQFKALEKKYEYFMSYWNLIDFTGLSLTLIIIIAIMSGSGGVFGYSALRIMASIATCCQLIKCYDWLRLLEDTSFYILLIGETLKDIKPFMVLLFVTLMTFGVPMVMLNLNRGEDNAVIEPIFGFWLLDLLMNQYLLALGEFNMDNFADNPQAAMCWIFFILATFITQLTMLNMLIAIMGDTFSRVMEKKEVNGIKTKLDLLSDLSAIMGRFPDDEGEYLFVVTPDDDELQKGNSWEGAVNKMKENNEKRFAEMQELFREEIQKLTDQHEADKKREAEGREDFQKTVREMLAKAFRNQAQSIVKQIAKSNAEMLQKARE